MHKAKFYWTNIWNLALAMGIPACYGSPGNHKESTRSKLSTD